jgi:hypothetical protein
MKLFTVLYSVMFLALPAMAREASLEPFVTSAREQYEKSGNENNTIESEYLNSEDITTEAKSSWWGRTGPIRELTSRLDQLKALSECVFYTEGAYGKHISKEQSEAQAEIFLSILENQMILSPDIYRVSNVPRGIVGSGCGVLLHSKLNHEIMFLTGSSAE